jgi:hypothetical protein
MEEFGTQLDVATVPQSERQSYVHVQVPATVPATALHTSNEQLPSEESTTDDHFQLGQELVSATPFADSWPWLEQFPGSVQPAGFAVSSMPREPRSSLLSAGSGSGPPPLPYDWKQTNRTCTCTEQGFLGRARTHPSDQYSVQQINPSEENPFKPEPTQAETNRKNRTEQMNRTKPNNRKKGNKRTEPDRTEPNRTEPNKSEKQNWKCTAVCW